MTNPTVIYEVPQAVIESTRVFLYSVGLQGCEGTGLWIGHEDAGARVRITRFLAPEQICSKSVLGVAVDLTRRAHLTLIDNLARGEQFYARVHSHPGRAYHSAKDNANPILSHEGAISIVVPNFARQGVVLSQCAVYRLRHGSGWLPLSDKDIRQIFEVTP